MLVLTTWMLATTLSLTPISGAPLPKRIDVDCDIERILEHALIKAKKFDDVDIYLHGVCRGNFVIASDGVTLRAATPGSGIAAPEGDSGNLPALEVVDAKASLRGLVVRGAVVGVFVRGWDAEVLLYEVDVHEQGEVGVIASRGATVRLLDTTVRDGFIGVVADTDSTINLQNVVVTRQDVGVIVFQESSAALNDTTIENNREAGLAVQIRSDVNVLGGVFRENGQVHFSATDWSSISLLYDVMIGSESDRTTYALGVARNATIASFTTPAIYGEVSALVGGSIRLGNTVLHGNLSAAQFSNAFVRDSEITGVVTCRDGADAICRQTTTGGAFDCPSPTCGPGNPEAAERAPSIPEFPVIDLPRFELPSRSRTAPEAIRAQ